MVTARSVFEHRAVVLGRDRVELTDGLAALAQRRPVGTVVSGVAGVAGKTVFVFPGQGSQWAGMAVGLMDASPVFASRIHECAAALAGHGSSRGSGRCREGLETENIESDLDAGTDIESEDVEGGRSNR